MKEMANGIILGAVGLMVLAGLSLAPPAGARQVAAVFPPWESQGEILSQISDIPYRLVRSGWSDTILIVDVSDAPEMREVLAERAWFLADALALGTCMTVLESER